MCNLGKQSTADILRKFCSEREIKIYYSSPNTHTNNAFAERQIKTINEILRYKKFDTNISEIIQTIYKRLNYLVNETTELNPYEIYFNKCLFSKEVSNQKINYEKLRVKFKEKSISNLKRTNKKRTEYNFKVNEKIFNKNKIARKQDFLWNGPYKILETNNNKTLVNNEIGINGYQKGTYGLYFARQSVPKTLYRHKCYRTNND
ncbi:hypothetical protein DMUE_5925 [Dictyocoela muelleri]|nr:hypothetical protein DMUE_5925 [Dictyocoela muelleri]